MKDAVNNKESFSENYTKFIQNLANHIAIITPFLSQLTSFLN